MWIIMLILLPTIGMIFFFIGSAIHSAIQDHKARKYATDWEFYPPQANNAKPKIGAEVSPSMHNEIKQYCQRHGISISDLIRTAVKAYMDSHQ